MVDFNKFEKDVKNKYGNQEFPFDEQNWEKAAKLIDASRKGKNRGGIFLLSAVALLCTTGLVYYFGFSDNAKSLEKNNLASNQIVTNTINSDNENGTPSGSENNNTVSSNTENANSSETINSTGVTAAPENKSATTLSNLNTDSEKAISVNTTKTNENAIAENKTSTTESKKEISSNTTDSSAPEIKITDSKNVSGKKPVQAKSGSQNSTPPVLGNDLAQNTTKPAASNVSSATTGSTEKLGDVSNTTEEPVKETVIANDSTPAIAIATVKPTKNNVIDSVPPMRKSKADSLAAMLPKGDGVSYATNVKEKHNAKNYLFMEAGTTYLFGWNSGSGNEAGGFNLLAGLNFQHYFKNTISAQIGVQYSTISNLTNTTHTTSTVNYDFGIEQDVTAIKYQKLHYLVAPVKLVFNAGDKNYIGIGCNVAYLLNSESKKEKYKTNSSDPNADKKDLTSTKETGYVEGFNPIDIQVSASYRRRIYKGLSANAEFIFGLTDTKNNAFFKSDNFDRNMGVKVSLCFDLFKK